MLVLTRKVGDVIAIGDDIKIVVMAIKGKQVRLGVQADRNTIVHREEVYQKIQQETRAAMRSDVDNANAAVSLLKSATKSSEDDSTTPSPTEGSRSGLSSGKCVIRRTSKTASENEPTDSKKDSSNQ